LLYHASTYLIITQIQVLKLKILIGKNNNTTTRSFNLKNLGSVLDLQ